MTLDSIVQIPLSAPPRSDEIRPPPRPQEETPPKNLSLTLNVFRPISLLHNNLQRVA